MARVLRSVRGHVYAYQVDRLADGRRLQRYMGPADAQEAAAFLARKEARKNAFLEASTGQQNERGYIDDPSGTTAATGEVAGRGFWRDGQPPAAFLAEAVAIYTARTGHPPALAYCAPCMVGELQGHGLELRAARLNARMLILAG